MKCYILSKLGTTPPSGDSHQQDIKTDSKANGTRGVEGSEGGNDVGGDNKKNGSQDEYGGKDKNAIKKDGKISFFLHDAQKLVLLYPGRRSGTDEINSFDL